MRMMATGFGTSRFLVRVHAQGGWSLTRREDGQSLDLTSEAMADVLHALHDLWVPSPARFNATCAGLFQDQAPPA